MSLMPSNVPDQAYNEYESINDIIRNENGKTLLGHNVSGKHVMTIDGINISHHRLIKFVGEYEYNNVIIGTKGSKKTAYVKRGSNLKEVAWMPLPLKTEYGEKTDFIVISRGDYLDRITSETDYLYHIPSGTISSMPTSYEKVSRVQDNVFNIVGGDKHIIWNGNDFEYYSNEDTDSPVSNTETFLDPKKDVEKEIQTTDMREAYKYMNILDRIVEEFSIINNRKEAKKMLNENIDFSNIEIEGRKLQHIKSKFVEDKIDINEFEEQIKQLLNKSSEITGDIVVDKKPSEEEKEKERMN